MGSAERSIIKRIYFILMLGFLACVFISHKAWFALTDFPSVSFLAIEVPHFVFKSLSGVLVLLAFIQPFAFTSRLILRLIILVMLVLFLLNQSLIQPWAWMYFLMIWLLSPFARYHFEYKELSPLLAGFRVLVALIYVCSGVLKLNPGFGEWALPFMLQPLTNVFWQFKPEIESFFLFIPFFEIIAGITLLMPFVARFTRYGLITMHVAIMALLGPLGLNYNEVVWPWNLQMILLLLVVFPHNYKAIGDFPMKFLVFKTPGNVVLGICLLALSLTYFKVGNSYQAFDLYSGRITYPEVALAKDKLKRIPAAIDTYTYASGDSVYVNYYAWSFETLNIPPCPAPWCEVVFEEKVKKRVSN